MATANFGMDFSKLLSQIDTVNTKKTYDNDQKNYWKPTKDKAGNATAVIRFLPNKDIDDFPFVRKWSHSFKNKTTNRWYIENSLSTINEQDYISEVNRELWNSGLEENKKIAQQQKRKLQYISNILVIKDTGNPENNGKVFLFAYGQKIFDKIVAAAKVEEVEEGLDDDTEARLPINAFDVYDGANFTLRQTIVSEFPNYDTSTFGTSKAICSGDEKEIKTVLDRCYDLNLEVAADKFKKPEELKDKYLWVMGLKDNSQTKNQTKSQEQKDVDDELDSLALASKVQAAKQTERKRPPMPIMEDESNDDDSAFFASLIDE